MGEIIYFIELIFWHVCCSSVLRHYSIWRHLYFYASKTISNSYCVQRSRIDFLRVGSYFFIKHKPKENKIKVLADKKTNSVRTKANIFLLFVLQLPLYSFSNLFFLRFFKRKLKYAKLEDAVFFVISHHSNVSYKCKRNRRLPQHDMVGRHLFANKFTGLRISMPIGDFAFVQFWRIEV